MAVIAMAREMGTRGGDVALEVADRLGLEVIHHELVEHDIATWTGMPESQVHRLLEGEASMWERWKLDERRMSRYTALEILELAARGNVLIRGWGATYLLKSIPHVVCVRICAPMPFREAVLKNRIGLKDTATARREIERNDAAHSGTMQRLFGIDWRDETLYALMLNSARVPIEDCVDHIVRMAQSPAFQQTPESRKQLMDQLVLARVRSALERAYGAATNRYGFEVEVADGKVTLHGATPDAEFIADTIRLLQDVEGVTGVESKVAHISFVSYSV